MRRRYPAFGRQLYHARARGQHPPRAWVIYGEHCFARRPAGAPSLCVDLDYRSHTLDWSILVGLPAHVVWRDGERIRELVAEVAYFAAPVTVHFISAGLWPYAPGQAVQMPAEDFLYCAAIDGSLWSPALEADYLARTREWECALIEDALARHDRQKTA